MFHYEKQAIGSSKRINLYALIAFHNETAPQSLKFRDCGAVKFSV